MFNIRVCFAVAGVRDDQAFGRPFEVGKYLQNLLCFNVVHH
jgi:hypothetical protein